MQRAGRGGSRHLDDDRCPRVPGGHRQVEHAQRERVPLERRSPARRPWCPSPGPRHRLTRIKGTPHRQELPLGPAAPESWRSAARPGDGDRQRCRCRRASPARGPPRSAHHARWSPSAGCTLRPCSSRRGHWSSLSHRLYEPPITRHQPEPGQRLTTGRPCPAAGPGALRHDGVQGRPGAPAGAPRRGTALRALQDRLRLEAIRCSPRGRRSPRRGSARPPPPR